MGRGLLAVAFASALVSGCGKSDDTAINEIKLQRVVQGFVLANLKDPGSAEFRNQKGMCGEVNSKNSFGGYAGFQRYMAANENMVVFERGGQLSAQEFEQVWAQSCK